MQHVGRDELAHARWKSGRLRAVVSLSFGVGETNCSQGIRANIRNSLFYGLVRSVFWKIGLVHSLSSL